MVLAMEQRPADLSSRLLDAAVELLGRSGGIGTVRVNGGSMRPTLQAGQRLAVQFGPRREHRGDMLVFRQADYMAVHRLLGRSRRNGRTYLRTRGDAVPRLDPPVFRESIVGRVIAIEADDGWRGTRGPLARAYGKAVALHDYFWAGVHVAAGAVGGARRQRLQSRLGRVDRRLLRKVHGLLFRACHRRVPPPDVPAEAARDPAVDAPSAE